MAMHAPFLVLSPDGFNPSSSTQKQQQNDHADIEDALSGQGHVGRQPPECIQEQTALCGFELTIRAPDTDLELRGWQSAADAPEDLPGAAKSRSLCLLASLNGQFLGVTGNEENLKANGERVAQVRGCTSFLFIVAASLGVLPPLYRQTCNGTDC
eukprot:1158053-Pelagomonas_calceolata.AAC.1